MNPSSTSLLIKKSIGVHTMTSLAATRVAMVSHRELAERQRERNKRRKERLAQEQAVPPTLTVAQRVLASQQASERRLLKSGGGKLLPTTLVRLLAMRMRRQEWDAALRVLELLRSQHWYTPLASTYITMLDMLGRCGRPAEAANLYTTMLKDGIGPSREALTALMAAYTRSSMVTEALDVLRTMESQPGCYPDCVTYTVLVKACCDAGRRDQAQQLLKFMEERGSPPNTVTYNTILHAHARARDVASARLLLQDMLRARLPPDCWTLNAAIRCFGRAGRLDEMEEWFQRLTAGGGLEPDSMTLHSLLDAYAKGGDGMLDKMQCCLRYMYKYHYPLDSVTYNIILAAYGKSGRPLQMESAFQRMRASGLKPNAVTFSTLLSCYVRLGILHSRLPKLLRMLEVSHDLKWDRPLFNALLDAFRHLPDLDRLEEYFRRMKSTDGCIPDDITYSTMILAYDEHNLPQRAAAMRTELDMLRQKQGPYSPP